MYKVANERETNLKTVFQITLSLWKQTEIPREYKYELVKPAFFIEKNSTRNFGVPSLRDRA
jgi:hypothetical protein